MPDNNELPESVDVPVADEYLDEPITVDVDVNDPQRTVRTIALSVIAVASVIGVILYGIANFYTSDPEPESYGVASLPAKDPVEPEFPGLKDFMSHATRLAPPGHMVSDLDCEDGPRCSVTYKPVNNDDPALARTYHCLVVFEDYACDPDAAWLNKGWIRN